MPVPISVTVLTKNSQDTLSRCLTALAAFPEVVVLDNGSSDATLSIAADFPNVKIFTSPFIGFGALKNLAASQATHDWILSVDSDEVLSTELVSSVLQHSLQPQYVYRFLRKNFYGQRYINACGWENDYVLRLYHKKSTAFSAKEVHETILTQGLKTETLPGTLDHFSYRNAEELVQKMNYYTSLFAQENKGKKRASVFKALYKGAFSFFRNYLLKKGFLYGADGFLISSTNALGSFYKYLKLHEANRRISTK